MLTSLCNFFCNKFFHKQEIDYRQSNVRCAGTSGKRLKLIDRIWSVNGLLRRTSSCSLSMQKENDFSDDEDCCIIAEIPRRKKPGNSVTKSNLPEPVQIAEPKFDLSKFRKDPGKSDGEDVKYLGESCAKEGNGKPQPKKFFTTSRSPGIRKTTKARLSYKSYLKRKMNYMQENYRLTEKYQYIQLLRSQTTLSFTNSRVLSKSGTNSGKQIEVIDLSDEKASDSDSGTTKTDKTDDQDVQIMSESSGVRSFQDILKIRPMTAKIALKEISSGRCNGDSDALALPNHAATVLDDEYGDLAQKTDILEEKLRNFMQITGPSVVEVESRESCYLPELTSEQERRIKNAFVPEPSQEVLSEGFGLKITRRDMQTLFGLNWINDEIINFYMNLIMERSKTHKRLPRVYAFNTFFYPKLVSCGYNSLRRWTKQVDIFSYDLILVPIHLGMHWCLAVIDFRCSSVQYYDSVGSPNDSCLERLLLYLKAESIDKRNKTFPTSNWTRSNVEDIPQQMNGADCGVFSCMFAEFLARNCSISFTQDDMAYFRKKIVIEILQKALLT